MSEDAEPGLAEAIALLDKGVTLGQLGRLEEALVVYDDVIARYADAPEPGPSVAPERAPGPADRLSVRFCSVATEGPGRRLGSPRQVHGCGLSRATARWRSGGRERRA